MSCSLCRQGLEKLEPSIPLVNNDAAHVATCCADAETLEISGKQVPRAPEAPQQEGCAPRCKLPAAQGQRTRRPANLGAPPVQHVPLVVAAVAGLQGGSKGRSTWAELTG
jgi:hypothetical protein